ncbi:MAG: GH1 family beta-glucosidase [Spirochaetota bacterium]
MKHFDDSFIFGAATASYQIEGAHDADGRTPSIWDTFSHTPGKVSNGDTGDVACDHYNRYREDVRIMKELGIQFYRFSVAWPRIVPAGGTVNRKGLDFYHRLTDELLENGITPAITVYHWDLPQWIDDTGGWLNRDTAKRFLDYSDILFREFNDKVGFWITHNEPYCASFTSYLHGEHAPGHTDYSEAVRAAHHILLSHGMAVERYREIDTRGGQIGITCNHSPFYPAGDTEADRAAAHIADGHLNRWFLEPLFNGKYPEDMVRHYTDNGISLDCIQDGDLGTIAREIDFYGINYYTHGVVKHDPQAAFGIRHVDTGREKTDMGWEIVPYGIYDCLSRIRDEYTSVPLYITENGSAFEDTVVDGQVIDTERETYLVEHLREVARLNEDGVGVAGYFCWSLLDNFEWAYGYSKRFGIVRVDYDTQERIVKQSGRTYARIIRERTV